MSTNTILLDRDDLISALSRLIALLRERHVAAGSESWVAPPSL